jgi:hypothetical protein
VQQLPASATELAPWPRRIPGTRTILHSSVVYKQYDIRRADVIGTH